MAVEVIDKIKPKNGGSFPVVEAVDVEVSEGLRLPEALEAKADASAVESKAEKTTTDSLQAQIDQLITPVTQDAEVQNARVAADGTSYQTLKARLDADSDVTAGIKTDISEVVTMEQGGISTSGAETTATNRIRTVGYVHGNGRITLSDTNYRITYVFYYDPATLELLSYENPDARVVTLTHPEYYARFIVTKYDRTSDLTPSDVDVTLSTSDLMASLKEISTVAGEQNVINVAVSNIQDDVSDIKSDISDIVTMEQGTINTEGGEQASTIRIRSVGYVFGNGKITFNSSGFRVYYVFYYDPITFELLYTESPDSQTATLSHPECVARFTVCTSDRVTDLTPSDVTVTLTASELLTSLKEISNVAGEQTVLSNSINGVKSDISKTVSMEQGGISTAGKETEANNRIRSSEYLYGSGKVTLSDTDFRITYIMYYDPLTLEYLFYENPDARTVTLNHNECLARIIVTRYDRTSNLTPSDVTVTISTSDLMDSLKDLSLVTGAGKTYVIPFEQGGINTAGGLIDSDKRVRSMHYLPGTLVADTNEQYTHFFAVRVYDKKGNLMSDMSTSPLSNHIELNYGDDYYVRLVVARRTAADGSYNVDTAPKDVTIQVRTDAGLFELTCKNIDSIIQANLYTTNQKNLLYNIPTVVFDRDYTLREYEEIELDFSDCRRTADADVRLDNQPASTFVTQIYALFDALAAAHPDFITKTDPAVTYSLEYPEYANGVSGSEAYLDTPAYKVYMYKLSSPNQNIGTTTRHPHQKMILFGGVHGNEYAAPYNLYQWAKELSENYLDDPNIFKLRNSFDIYIVPVVNGYGAFHRQRGNGDNVNINRNFPCIGWEEKYEDTKYHAGRCAYTGPEAGSEFETKLIMALLNDIKPSIAIDHHNYGQGELHQFYTIFPRVGQLRFSYQATTEVAYVFKKNYPEYFGTNFGCLQELPANSPYTIVAQGGGEMPLYMSETCKIPICGTIEISSSILYNNGVNDGSFSADSYGTDTFSLGEYTLRNQLLRFCQFVLEHAPDIDKYWQKDVLLP